MTAERILIVDDEEMNRRLLEAILVGEGYEVVEAADGAAGLEMLGSTPVDLVLLDVMMPTSGLEVCRQIRADSALSHLPVVFVTALGDRESRIRGKDIGADDFLTKPVDDVELLVRVRSLLRLKAQHDAKEKQRRLMGAILESMGEGVVAIDEAAGLTLINAAAERILGPATEWPEMVDWPGPNQVLSGRGYAADATATPLARALDGGATTDLRLVLGPGPATQGLHLSVSATPLSSSGDAGRSAVAVFRDVTELVELDRFKTEMTSLVVHDLKNVMTVIGTSLEHASELASLPGSEGLLETLSDARDAASRAGRLIANLMDVSRLENRRLVLRLIPMEANALCEASVRHRISQLRSHGVELTIDADGAPPIRADLDVLQRVFDNILDNALRYTPRGGRIVMTASGDAVGVVRVRIGNTGPAIPPEDRTRIFEKYGQVHPASDAGMNAGLGLYFCRLAVAAHGGRIWAETTTELPTVFVIELPGHASPAAAPEPRARRKSPSVWPPPK